MRFKFLAFISILFCIHSTSRDNEASAKIAALGKIARAGTKLLKGGLSGGGRSSGGSRPVARKAQLPPPRRSPAFNNRQPASPQRNNNGFMDRVNQWSNGNSQYGNGGYPTQSNTDGGNGRNGLAGQMMNCNYFQGQF